MGKGRGSAKVWILLIVEIVIIGGLEGVRGVSYKVGDANGWTITNYTSWLAGKTFTSQDDLVFTYSSSQHDVMEVSQSNYNTCTTTSPLATHTDGNTTISLNTSVANNRYFICSIAGHCTAGMKLAVSVSIAETTTATPPPPNTNTTTPPSSSTPPPPPNTNSTTTTPPSPSTPSNSKANPSYPMPLALFLVGAPLALVAFTL